MAGTQASPGAQHALEEANIQRGGGSDAQHQQRAGSGADASTSSGHFDLAATAALRRQLQAAAGNAQLPPVRLLLHGVPAGSYSPRGPVSCSGHCAALAAVACAGEAGMVNCL